MIFSLKTDGNHPMVRKLPSIRIQMVPSVEAALATLPSVVVLVSALCLGISIFGAQVRLASKFTNTYM